MDNVLGLDIGYGQTKTYQPRDGAKKFPTLIAAPASEEDDFGERRQKIRVNGQNFYVGEDAKFSWVIDTRTPGFVGSDAWLAVIGKALLVNNIFPEDVYGLEIVLGLPPGLYDYATVERLKKTIRSAAIECDGQVYNLKETKLEMIPQGAGIYFAYVTGNPERDSVMSKNVAVIDLGYHMVDDVRFNLGGKYDADAQKSEPLGISVLLDRVRTKFSQEHGEFISEDKALALVREGKVLMFEQEYTLKALDELMESYSRRLNAHIEQFLEGTNEKAVDFGLVAGGGILLMTKYLKVRKKVLVMADPEIANAKGYWCYGVYRKK